MSLAPTHLISYNRDSTDDGPDARSIRQSRSIARAFSSSPSRLSTPAPADQPGPSVTSPKIAPIVDSIATLTLLEVSELVTALKVGLRWIWSGVKRGNQPLCMDEWGRGGQRRTGLSRTDGHRQGQGRLGGALARAGKRDLGHGKENARPLGKWIRRSRRS